MRSFSPMGQCRQPAGMNVEGWWMGSRHVTGLKPHAQERSCSLQALASPRLQTLSAATLKHPAAPRPAVVDHARHRHTHVAQQCRAAPGLLPHKPTQWPSLHHHSRDASRLLLRTGRRLNSTAGPARHAVQRQGTITGKGSSSNSQEASRIVFVTRECDQSGASRPSMAVVSSPLSSTSTSGLAPPFERSTISLACS